MRMTVTDACILWKLPDWSKPGNNDRRIEIFELLGEPKYDVVAEIAHAHVGGDLHVIASRQLIELGAMWSERENIEFDLAVLTNRSG